MALGKKNKDRSFKPPKLQITSMMDMFTIILIFLLFSFSEKPEMEGIDGNMQLPVSTAKTNHGDTVKLFLSTTQLKLQDTVIGKVVNDRVIGLDPKSLKSSRLYQELSRRARERDAASADKKEPPSVLFFCDRRLPYQTINNITKTAVMAGYPNFQLAVLEN